MTGVLTRMKKFVFRTIRRMPYVGKKIDAEVSKQRLGMEEKFHQMAKRQSYIQKLPASGMSEVKWLKNLYISVFRFLTGGAAICRVAVCCPSTVIFQFYVIYV